MSKNRMLLCVAAAVCVSGRCALLLVCLLALTRLLAGGIRSLLRVLTLPCPAPAVTMVSVAAGSTLYLLFLAFVPGSSEDLGAVLPLLLLFFLCGTAACEQELSFWQLMGTGGVLLMIGCVREVLSAGTLLTYPLPLEPAGDVFGRNAAGAVGTGGILVAAALLWLLGGGRALKKPTGLTGGAALRVGLVTVLSAAADGVLRMVLPDVSDLWRFWVCLLPAVIPLLWAEWAFAPVAAVVPPLAVLLVSGDTLLTWVVTGIVTGVVVFAVAAAWDRPCRSSVPSRFAGPPAVLTATAIITAALGAI